MSVTPCSCLSHYVWVGSGTRRKKGIVVPPSVCSEATQLVTAPPPLTLTRVLELVDGRSHGQAKNPNEHLC